MLMQQSQTIQNKQSLAIYKSSITRYVRSAMALKNMRYEDLVAALQLKGISLTEENLRSKVSKGMFSADLFVAVIDVLGVEEVAVKDILNVVRDSG